MLEPDRNAFYAPIILSISLGIVCILKKTPVPSNSPCSQQGFWEAHSKLKDPSFPLAQKIKGRILEESLPFYEHDSAKVYPYRAPPRLIPFGCWYFLIHVLPWRQSWLHSKSPTHLFWA